MRGSFNAKCDVWSLGCCLYALLCHHPLRLEDHLKGEGTSQARNELRHLMLETSGVLGKIDLWSVEEHASFFLSRRASLRTVCILDLQLVGT